MSMQLKIEERSLQSTIKRLNKFSKDVHVRVGDHIDAVAENISLGAKARCAVRDNILRPSIHHISNKQLLNAKVSTDVKYAPYVEFGTGLLVDIPPGLEDYAAQFKGKGVRLVNLPARPFMFPAMEEERNNYINGLKAILRDA